MIALTGLPAADPDRASLPAVIDGMDRWTWTDLERHAMAIAAGLVAAGIGRGDRVALLASPTAGATLHF